MPEPPPPADAEAGLGVADVDLPLDPPAGTDLTVARPPAWFRRPFRGHLARGQEAPHTALFRRAAIAVIARIRPASVRAVAYQLFIAGWLPDMFKPSTNKVGVAIRLAREAETIPWGWITDERGGEEGWSGWGGPADYAPSDPGRPRYDPWLTQPARVAVWAEKGTVRATVEAVLDEYRVPFRVLHGFASATGVNAAARASLDLRPGQRYVVLYIGDCDPSGLYMSEVDLPRRLAKYGGEVDLRRLALTLDGPESDVLRPGPYNGSALPNFPTSERPNDQRRKWYEATHPELRERCWELDALSPTVLRDRLEAAIAAEIDGPAWAHTLEREEAHGQLLEVHLQPAWRAWLAAAEAWDAAHPSPD